MSKRNVIEQAVDAMEAALANTVNAGPYPDGPCMDKEVRDDLKAALAALRRYKVVEGGCYHYGGVTPGIAVWDFSSDRRNDDRPALLLVREEEP